MVYYAVFHVDLSILYKIGLYIPEIKSLINEKVRNSVLNINIKGISEKVS
jgi:hypothetical protein